MGLAVAGVTVKVGSFAPGLAALEIDRFDAATVTALLSINDARSVWRPRSTGRSPCCSASALLATGALPRWLSVFTAVAGAGMLLATAVPALDSLQLLFYVWALTVSGWLLVRADRGTADRIAGPVSA